MRIGEDSKILTRAKVVSLREPARQPHSRFIGRIIPPLVRIIKQSRRIITRRVEKYASRGERAGDLVSKSSRRIPGYAARELYNLHKLKSNGRYFSGRLSL